MRVDKNTGKKYSDHNIPMNRTFTVILPQVAIYRIMAEHHGYEQDVWYHNTFCGDRYAVFKRKHGDRYWQQITPWYKRFGYAQRKMFERYDKDFYNGKGV